MKTTNKKKTRVAARRKQPRNNRVTVMFNLSEIHAIERYCKRYRITNRSHLIRQVLLKTILRRMADDTPTLFD